MSRLSGRLLRLGGSLTALAVLVIVVSPAALRDALSQLSPSVLLVALVILLASHLAAALKWRMLMGPGAGISARTAFRAHFTGLVSSLSPFGMIGGDIVRAGVAMNGSTRASSIMVTSVVDRVVDSISLLILTLAGVVWVGGGAAGVKTVLWAGFLLVGIGIALSLVAIRWLKRARSAPLSAIRDAVQAMANQPRLIARALLMSIAVQTAFISASVYIGRAVGVDCSFGAWLVAWPAAKLVAYLPIGIAGIGIRESALVALLRPFGGAPGAVMAAGILWQAVFIVGSVLGWAVLSALPDVPADELGRSHVQ